MTQAEKDAALLKSWEDAKRSGLPQSALADKLGMDTVQLTKALYRAKKRLGKPIRPRVDPTAGLPSTDEAPPGDSLTIQRDGQEMELESKSGRIKTLADLLKACEVDTNAWRVERWVANKWEVGAKDSDGNVVVTPLFQVKANLIPVELKPVELMVKPIAPPVSFLPIAQSHQAAGRGLVLPDPQVGFRRDWKTGKLDPFQDRRALDAVLQIAQAEKFTDVVWLGDVLDFSEWTDKFAREPGFYFTTQAAVVEAYWWIAQYRKAAEDAAHVILEGNHEYRPETAMMTHLLAAHGLKPANELVKAPVLSVQRLLGLDELGVEYKAGYPNNETYLGPVRVVHGDIARAGYSDTVKKLVSDSQETVIQGHIHRIEWASKTIIERNQPRVVAAFSPGCLCRTDFVVPGHHRGQHWQQGACVVEWDEDLFSITPIVIADGKALYRGQVFTGRDVADQIRIDTGWGF